MFPTSSCYFGVASKDQVVSYDQETNAISETSRYSQDVLNEVLQHKKNGEIYYIAGCRQTKQQKQCSSSSFSSQSASDLRLPEK